MARKGKDAEVQVYVKTEEEWEKLIEKEVKARTKGDWVAQTDTL